MIWRNRITLINYTDGHSIECHFSISNSEWVYKTHVVITIWIYACVIKFFHRKRFKGSIIMNIIS